MVEEMRKMIRASWIVNIKSGRGVVGAMQDLWVLILLQSVKGACERAFMASDSGR